MKLTPYNWFIKEMGWDEPKYGWTKEKRLLKKLLKLQQEEDKKKFLELESMKEEQVTKTGYIFGDRVTVWARNQLRKEILDKLKVKKEK